MRRYTGVIECRHRLRVSAMLYVGDIVPDKANRPPDLLTAVQVKNNIKK